ncbi:MAG: hypothetical protein ACJA08_002566 [Cyclobacteriaceae bacterium]|jgi:hypothetical protein
MKKLFSPIVVLLLIFGCKVQQSTSTNNEEGTAPFYGAFNQNAIEWYLKKEQSIESESSEDKVSFMGRTYQAKSEKLFRTELSDFHPLPVVNYVYDDATRKVMEVHYEWDIINHLPKEEKYNVRIESKTRAEEFVSYFETLNTSITQQLGEGAREGSLTMDTTLEYEFIEVTDKWESVNLTCELYMIFSNHHEKKGVMEIKPTHRIRCKLKWK